MQAAAEKLLHVTIHLGSRHLVGDVPLAYLALEPISLFHETRDRRGPRVAPGRCVLHKSQVLRVGAVRFFVNDPKVWIFSLTLYLLSSAALILHTLAQSWIAFSIVIL